MPLGTRWDRTGLVVTKEATVEDIRTGRKKRGGNHDNVGCNGIQSGHRVEIYS